MYNNVGNSESIEDMARRKKRNISCRKSYAKHSVKIIENLKKKVQCECGSYMSYAHLSRHRHGYPHKKKMRLILFDPVVAKREYVINYKPEDSLLAFLPFEYCACCGTLHREYETIYLPHRYCFFHLKSNFHKKNALIYYNYRHLILSKIICFDVADNILKYIKII